MPELPEVEQVRRTLAPLVEGRRLAELTFLDALIEGEPRGACAGLLGRECLALGRRGKYLLFRWSGGALLVVHLRMTGRFAALSRGTEPGPHDRVLLRWEEEPTRMVFRDTRRFGRFAATLDGSLPPIPGLLRLGVEPFGVSDEVMLRLFQGRRQQAKAALLRQDLLAGVGNIYADEALFNARIHPEQLLSQLSAEQLLRLRDEVEAILLKATAGGGSTIRDFADALGMSGEYQDYHQVYGMGGKPCPSCGAPLQKMVSAGRGTTYCPECQVLR